MRQQFKNHRRVVPLEPVAAGRRLGDEATELEARMIDAVLKGQIEEKVYAGERLTRAEQRAESLRAQQLDTESKLADAQSKLEQIEYQLRPENIERAAGQIKAARQMDIPPKLVIPMRVIASVVAISCQLDAHVPTRRIADEMVPGFAHPD